MRVIDLWPLHEIDRGACVIAPPLRIRRRLVKFPIYEWGVPLRDAAEQLWLWVVRDIMARVTGQTHRRSGS